MTLPQIINSLLENDMYKFSMGQCIYHQFSAYKTTSVSYTHLTLPTTSRV